MRWIAAALAVHAGLLAALLTISSGRDPRAFDAAQAAAPAEFEITVESATATAREGVEEPTGARAEAGRPVAGSAAAHAASASANANANANAATVTTASSSQPMTASLEGEGPPSAAPRTSSSGTGAIPIPFSAADLGIGGKNPFLPRAEERPPSSGPDHPAARAMRGTGLARDRELGLGPEGPAIAALSDATTSSIAPLRGRALFVVRTGGDGLVSAIDLIDSDGGSGWMDAGRIALEKLRGKKLAVPRGANAMNMRIEVRSEMKLPNGENAPIGGRLGDNRMPEMTIPDVSNLGAKPRRVVHARAAGTDLL